MIAAEASGKTTEEIEAIIAEVDAAIARIRPLDEIPGPVERYLVGERERLATIVAVRGMATENPLRVFVHSNRPRGRAIQAKALRDAADAAEAAPPSCWYGHTSEGLAKCFAAWLRTRAASIEKQ
jgi:hypothetical protein